MSAAQPGLRGFKFSHVCDLLDELEHNRLLKSSTTGRVQDLDGVAISKWFNKHRSKIFGPSTDKLALLSCLLPARRPDRVLGLGLAALSRIIGRCLLLGSSRFSQLNRYKLQGNGDLGQCLENVLHQTDETMDCSALTVEEINDALDKIGAKNRFSSPELRNKAVMAVDVEKTLGTILRKIHSREAKWLVRIILRDQITGLISEDTIFKNFHFLLPYILSVRGSLQKAVQMLDIDPLCTIPSFPEARSRNALCRLATPYLTPLVGCKVGRPTFLKARSIEHCSNLIGQNIATVQRKYDGEYFQAHVDCTQQRQGEITIFSKSGKNSTSDRVGIHELVRRSLQLDRNEHKVEKCILEGELLVWSDQEQDILPFYHIRKHITRRGLRLGAENDSQPEPWEHLYVVFFDVLLLNDRNCLAMPLKERRVLLSEIIHCIPGGSALVEYHDIDFSQSGASDDLRNYFAQAIAHRWEGLVLKSLNSSYHLSHQSEGPSHTKAWVKLKKDYIPGLGDTADFAIIGAFYDSLCMPPHNKIVKNLRWTNFLVGCREDCQGNQNGGKPIFRVVACIDHHNLPAQVLRTLNIQGQFVACDWDDEDTPFSVKSDQLQSRKAKVIFRQPFVVEMYGAGFERPHNVKFWSLRFPRVTKVHQDRDWQDALSFHELQVLAQEVMSASSDIQRDVDNWMKRLRKHDDDDDDDGLEADSDTARSQVCSQEIISLLGQPASTEVNVAAVVQQVMPPHSQPGQPCHKIIAATADAKFRFHEQSGEREVLKQATSSLTVHSAVADISDCSQIDRMPPFFSAHPILLGTSVSNSNPRLQRFVQGSAKCTSSLPKFLDAAISPGHFIGNGASCSTPIADCCRGIIFVDTDRALVGRAASDISNMGNAIAARRRAGKLKHSGFFIVLDWHIIESLPSFAMNAEECLNDSKGRVNKDAWIASARRFYAGCLRWHEEGPRRLGGEVSSSKKRKLSDTDAEGDQTLVPSSIPPSFSDAPMQDLKSDVLYDTRNLETLSHCVSS